MFSGYNKSLKMNNWIRNECRQPSTGLLVTDIDFLFTDYKTGDMMLVEVKTFNAKIKFWQENIYKKLDKALRSDNKYKGFFIVTLSDEYPESSEIIKINSVEVNTEKLRKFLNFEIEYNDL